MEITTIDVRPREAKGSKQVARLREQGLMPAVLYGQGRDSLKLSLEEREFERHVRQHHKVFRLRMDGKEQGILLQDIQWDVLTDRPLHVDFLRIELDKPIQVHVELTFLGHPAGISRGGRLIQDHSELLIECLPHQIPETVEVRVAHLDLGDQITVNEIEVPPGVKIDMPADEVICHLPGEAQLLAEAAAEEAAEEAAAAEAAEGAEPVVAGEEPAEEEGAEPEEPKPEGGGSGDS